MSIEQLQILPQDHQLLINLHKGSHPLVIEKSLKLAVWTAAGLGYLREEFQEQLPNLSLAKCNMSLGKWAS